MPAVAPVPARRRPMPSKSTSRQQRRAGDARLRIGLLDARDRGRDVEIGEMRALDQRGQFARAEAAPPVRRRQCGVRLARRRPIVRRDVDDRTGRRVPVVSMQPDRHGASASASARRETLLARLLRAVVSWLVTKISACSCGTRRRPVGELGAAFGRHRGGRRRDRSPASPARRPAARCAPRPARHASCAGSNGCARNAAWMRSNARLSVSRAPSAAASRARNAARSFSASAAGSGAASRSMRAAAVRGRSVAAGCAGIT